MKRGIAVSAAMVAIFVCGYTYAQDAQDAPAEGPKAEESKKEEIQQKITTPPLQLSEEEDKRAPAGGARPVTRPPEEAAVEPSAPAPEEAAETKSLGEITSELAPIRTKTKTELILDASGSMNGLMGPTTKMAILKSVADDIISQPLPEGVKRIIGLRVYGNQKPSDEGNCKDSELLIPIEPLDTKEFKEKLSSINALGVTPIGYALEEAVKDFDVTDEYDNVIILVTDGADSCNADLCKIAEGLHAGDKKIMINVIGFDLDENAKESLTCIAEKADGQFTVARSEDELMSSLDQVLMADIPYNLRLKIVSGATPLPAGLKVYRSGTKQIIREDETTGIKYYQLPPGTYDIDITYKDSLEKPPPSKLLRGVEVQATSKAEQVVQFDLGMLTLAAFDQEGAPIPAAYLLRKVEDPKIIVKVQSEATPTSVFLTEGAYNVSVQAVTPEGLKLKATADGLKIAKGASLTHEFQFQSGKVYVSGKDTKGNPVPIRYIITPVEEKKAEDKGKEEVKKEVRIEGTAPPEGKTIDLPPGKYNIAVSLSTEKIEDLPTMQLDGVEVAAGDFVEREVEIPTATLTLVGKDSDGRLTETLFTVKVNGSRAEPAQFPFVKDPISLVLPPGRYDIKAIFEKVDFEPTPVISWEAVPLLKDQTLAKEAILKFGIINLFGKNSKGAPVESVFYIYNVGEEEPFITLSNILSPTEVKLTEGFYDIMAENLTARSDPKPNVWFHNINVQLGKPETKEAIFRNGLLKMICNGPNNIKLTCDYKVYPYGTDSPLFEGTTVERWIEFDIPPGNYYIEAGYHDIPDEVLLKKWITFKVDDNEMVEQVIRF